MRLLAGILMLGVLVAVPAAAQADPTTAPAGTKALLELMGVGVQVYACRDQAGGPVWTFVSPGGKAVRPCDRDRYAQRRPDLDAQGWEPNQGSGDSNQAVAGFGRDPLAAAESGGVKRIGDIRHGDIYPPIRHVRWQSPFHGLRRQLPGLDRPCALQGNLHVLYGSSVARSSRNGKPAPQVPCQGAGRNRAAATV